MPFFLLYKGSFMKYLLSVVVGIYFLSLAQIQEAWAQRISEPTHAPLPTLIVYTPTITPTDTPMDCVEAIAKDTVDFEEFPEGATGQELSETLASVYGIQITSLQGGAPQIVGIAREGEAEPRLFGWLSLKCPKKPNHNRLCNGGDGGRRVLSLVNALNTKTIRFTIEFIEPVQLVQFDLADVDGDEVLAVKAYNEIGEVLDQTEFNQKGYGWGTENSALSTYEVKNASRIIKKIEVVGTKNIKVFGFGIDNIRTGLVPCSTGGG